MQGDLIIRQPDAAAHDAELLLLFHGVGSSAEDLAPLGQALATRRPLAWIVSVRAPDRSDFGSGWQWFSVQGVTEANRPERVAAALPAFADRVAAWQRQTGVGAERTTLLGFSQGAIMALESTQPPDRPRIAGRVKAIDFVEDRITRLGPQRDAGTPLWSRSEVLQPWATVSGATMTVEAVEQWFERLALAAQGPPDALGGLPPGREAAAALLVLREFMHHRGHPSIRVVEPRQALVDRPEAA